MAQEVCDARLWAGGTLPVSRAACLIRAAPSWQRPWGCRNQPGSPPGAPRACGALAEQAVSAASPASSGSALVFTQRISAALLLCRPGSHLPFLLAVRDSAASGSAGTVEGRGDLGWFGLGWGSQGCPGQGKGSRRCTGGRRQPKLGGVNLLPVNPAGWSSPRAGRCRRAVPPPGALCPGFGHRGGRAGTASLAAGGCRQGEGRASRAGRRQPGRVAS